jgi:hypothetical protein
MSLTAGSPQPSLAWQFESSNVDSVTGIAPNLITTGTYAAPTGGTITTVSGKRIHTFTTVGNDSITFLVPTTIQLLVVAGGGGGGSNNNSASAGGGGGAGEMYYSASYSVTPGTYTITVGAAGTGGLYLTTRVGVTGGDSVFGPITAAGGGGGGGPLAGVADGLPGGSGGGVSRSGTTGGDSVKTAGGLGNKGGDNVTSGVSGAGGGGAGGAGANATTSTGTSPAGGVGSANSISGVSITYAAGGAGGSRNGTGTPAAGVNGRGEGGDGASAGGTAGSNGRNGARGGSGVVVIAYNAALYPEPTYVTGKYKQAINFNNTLSPAGADPNCYAIYDVSEFNLTSNSATMSLWLNSGLTYPITTGCNPYYINLQGTTYYSLQTETTNRSSISFHTGSSPNSIIQTEAQTSIWNHYCAVFSNVGTTEDSNTASYFYLNGSLVGSGNTLSQNFTTLNLGCQSSGGNGALCSIDDIRLFNTALTASQVQSIYKAQGMPSVSNWMNTIGTSKSFFINR